jgi:hypothetical protein
MNAWPFVNFEGPVSPAKRVAGIGPEADRQLSVHRARKAELQHATQLPTLGSCFGQFESCSPFMCFKKLRCAFLNFWF